MRGGREDELVRNGEVGEGEGDDSQAVENE